MRINFDFGDLEAFLAVSELNSFQRAADQLNISQSALSRRIQKLEEVLGVTLIERTTRTMKLTLAARGFRIRAQAMLDEAAEALRALGDETAVYDRQRNAIVTVAAIPTATHNILPSIIKDFSARGHGARIRVLDLFANDVAEAVAQGEADFGISFIGAQEPELTFRTLMDDDFVLVMTRDDPLCRYSRIRWADVDERRFIAPWKGSGNRMLIDNALAHSRKTLNWTYEVRHSSTALGLVAAGVGVTALPASAIPQGEHHPVMSRPLIEPGISRAIGTLRRTRSRLSPAAELFYGILVERWSNDAGNGEA
ncbi:LysR family transcriptional regulator [Pelagibius sp. Alg239-R121]|uniref:LysR family transcriptional regulator n=1 Tax=Pelagibius sp. Alg239-R121 TaxID=2993448 RepID=UPI0024A6704E|nr:LysR family transcriptional regulator [Pelagibius sp. Alg239-R121]